MDAGITTAIDPLLLAREGRHVRGELQLEDLPRLAVLSCEPAAGVIIVDLQFSCDVDHRSRMQGNASGQLEVTCQRCLESMSLSIDSEINVLLVSQEEDTEEALVMCEGKTTVAKLIEDELLLVMPMFAKHATGDCSNKENAIGSVEADNKQKDKQKENPFAVLATLKSGKQAGKK